MKSLKTRALLGAFGTAASVALVVVGVAMPAQAANAAAIENARTTAASQSEPKIAGYTETSFVAAALKQGVKPATAKAAWGNREAMAAIPVSSDSFPGVPEPRISALSTNAVASTASGTCWKKWNNLVGAEILRVTLNKQWSYSGSTISSPTVQFYGQAGFPYVYDGQTGSNDYYSTAYENSHGTHTSYRQGVFHETLTQGGANASATLVSKLAGAYSCSYSGGV
jgi:hypothetical protein